MNQNKQGGAVMVALAGVFWSFAGVLGKFAPWNPITLTGFRSLVAVLLLGLIRGSFRPNNTKWNWIGGAGVAATSVLFICANKMTSSANAIVLQYAMTAIVIAAQILIFRAKPKKADIVAAVLVMAGVVLCFCQGLSDGGFAGNVLGLASAFTWALVFLSARMPGVDALSYSYQGNLISLVLIVAMPFDKSVAAGGFTGVLAAVAMGICLGMGYFCFSRGMKSGLSPTVAAIVANIEPVLNPIWVFLFLHQAPGVLSVAGAALVLTTVTVYSARKDQTV